MQKYSKLFKTQETKHSDLDLLNHLLQQFEEDPIELMDKTLKRKLS